MTKTIHNLLFKPGSALVIAVILTSLLAIVGVMFVMVARVDKMATSAIADNKQLNLAVDSVVAEISQQLALDVPRLGGAEYYDYPGPADAWLANLEPYPSGTNYYWRQISDVYNKNFSIPSPGLQADIVPDYQPSSQIGDSNNSGFYRADADGDGVYDSVWVRMPQLSSNKGKPVYAAIRVIDNGAMLNVNTAYKFDSNGALTRIDGSDQLQVNLMALASQPGDPPPTPVQETDLLDARANYGVGVDPLNLEEYKENVIWRYNEPNGTYTPFDISDELELRYRFLLNQSDIDTRLESLGPIGRRWGFRKYAFTTPVEPGELNEWFISTSDNTGSLDPNYAYRHIATTYNMDRIIDSDSRKMTNINSASVADVCDAMIKGLQDADPNFAAFNMATQIAVNLIDYRDSDSNVTVRPVGVGMFYGFERPCVYISELAHKFVQDPCDPNIVYRSYAIELYNPYAAEDNIPDDLWRLVIVGFGGGTFPINGWTAGAQYYVLLSENLNVPPFSVASGAVTNPGYSFAFAGNDRIQLQRRAGPGPNWLPIYPDLVNVPIANDTTGWLKIPPESFSGVELSLQRDIQKHKCIRRLWDLSTVRHPSLGADNEYKTTTGPDIQAHPADRLFTNVGEIGELFRVDAYTDINSSSTEASVRVNLADSYFQHLFRYLTVFDPAIYSWNDLNETRVKGRININTAPWFVIAQLPWVSNELAQAIVAYRDQLTNPVDYSLRLGLPGFASIGQLNEVRSVAGGNNYRIDSYALDTNDLAGFPDLTGGDGAKDDFEERDVIFSRISNLVTVRSDVFTAYILVRIGTDGPQKRVIAILDRSDVYPTAGGYTGQVKVIALHPVPDPR